MNTNEKQLWIVEKLKTKDISSEKLAFELNISEKTLSNYVSVINHYFQNTSKIVKNNNKYSLLIKDERYFDLLNQFIEDNKYDEKEQYERKKQLLYYLLIKDRTIDELSELMYLSTTSLNQVLKELRLETGSFHIDIIGKTSVGIRLEGTEFNIRRLLIEKYTDIYDSNQLTTETCEELKKIKQHLNLDNTSYNKVVTATKIVFARLKLGKYNSKFVEFESLIAKSTDFKEINGIVAIMHKLYPNVNTDKEVLSIVMQLMGRRASLVDELINDTDENLIQQIIEHTIQDVDELYQIKLDESLFTKDIMLHIKHLMNRLLFNVNIDNVESFDIVKQFPFAYELSKILGENVYKAIGVRPSIDELGYIAIYFSVYLENLEKSLVNYKLIAIATDMGLSIHKFLSTNLKTLLGEEIQIDILKLQDVDEKRHDYDLIISTTHHDKQYDNVIHLDNVFNLQLLKFKIEQYLIFKDNRGMDVLQQNVLLGSMLENNFVYLTSNASYQDVIEEMVTELSVSQDEQLIIQENLLIREDKKSTVYGEMAFPHTSYSGNKLMVKAGIITKHIEEEPHLKLVILLITPNESVNDAMLIKLYEEILSVASNKYLLSKLNSETSYESFINILKLEMEG